MCRASQCEVISYLQSIIIFDVEVSIPSSGVKRLFFNLKREARGFIRNMFLAFYRLPGNIMLWLLFIGQLLPVVGPVADFVNSLLNKTEP